jgi:hypothetical protein
MNRRHFATSDITEPFPVPYPSMMGQPNELRAWVIPANLLRDGANQLELVRQQGAPATALFLDLATPAEVSSAFSN